MFTQKTKRLVVLITLSLTMVFMNGGCANKQPKKIGAPTTTTTTTTTPTPAPAPAGKSASMSVSDNVTFSNIKVYSDPNGLVWVPLEETASSINYELHNTDQGLSMGDTDPVYTVKVNETQALSGNNPIQLPQAPKFFDNKPYMTTQALSTLIGTQVNWNPQHSQVIFSPINDSSLSEQLSSSGTQPGSSPTGQIQSLAVGIDKSQLISYAQTFLGTPYKFSSGPYPNTHTFDCSSFVQYVYAHFGVKLPRASRSQAQVGRTINMNNLQTGDLMFFYTPGRYASNRIVGHVGMYIGNGRFIQTYGRPGVIISDFTKYWKGRFLYGKRVA